MIPDVSPVELLGLKADDGTGSQDDAEESSGPPDFSMAAGEFLEVYSDQVSHIPGSPRRPLRARWTLIRPCHPHIPC
jgi:hypothetical protein